MPVLPGTCTRTTSRKLPDAIRRASTGRSTSARASWPRLRGCGEPSTTTASRPRETDVLRLIALGFTSSEISNELHLSRRTVETHRNHIHRKLGLSKRWQLVRYALDHSLIGQFSAAAGSQHQRARNAVSLPLTTASSTDAGRCAQSHPALSRPPPVGAGPIETGRQGTPRRRMTSLSICLPSTASPARTEATSWPRSADSPARVVHIGTLHGGGGCSSLR